MLSRAHTVMAVQQWATARTRQVPNITCGWLITDVIGTSMEAVHQETQLPICDKGPYTPGHLKFKAIQDFSRLFEKEIQDCFI